MWSLSVDHLALQVNILFSVFCAALLTYISYFSHNSSFNINWLLYGARTKRCSFSNHSLGIPVPKLKVFLGLGLSATIVLMASSCCIKEWAKKKPLLHLHFVTIRSKHCSQCLIYCMGIVYYLNQFWSQSVPDWQSWSMMSAEQDKRLHSNISLVLPPHHLRLRILDNVLAEVIHLRGSFCACKNM